MLPAHRRLRTRTDHLTTVRRGSRAGRRTVVVHLLPAVPATRQPARAGFVVASSVGGSVVRHRVVRRLRALVAPRLDRLPPGARLIVRALPPAATASSAELGKDLDGALATALRRAYRHAPALAGSAEAGPPRDPAEVRS